MLDTATSFHAARRYRGLIALESAWDALVDRGARSILAGRSHEGRPLRCLGFGPADAPVASVALAGIHAMEWIGVESLTTALERLVDDPPRDRRVLAFPLVNPDGFARCEGDLRAGRTRFRRGNARGVDLNRNWPTSFRGDAPLSVLLPWVFNPGAAARSEPEIDGVLRALDGLAAQGVRITRALSMHSFGRRVLYPYGARWRAPDDVEAHRAAARAVCALADDGYKSVQSARWVPGAFAYGMEIDHLHDAFGATSLLVECSRAGVRAADASSWTLPFAWFNPPDPARDAALLAPAIERFVRAHTAPE